MKAYLNRKCPEDAKPKKSGFLWRKRVAKPVPEEDGPTVARVAADFLSTCGSRNKRSTCATYTTVLQAHVLPIFAERDITRITMEEVNTFLCDKTCAAAERALSPSTVRSIITVLRALFQYAARFDCAVYWKDIHGPSRPPEDTVVLSEEAQSRLRTYCCEHLNYDTLGVLICLYTGMRLGEICALKWEDVNVAQGTITVRRTVQRIRNAEHQESDGYGTRTRVIFDVPKSRSSTRCIPVPGFLLPYLRSFRCRSECFVLTGQQDHFMEPRLFQKRYKNIMADADVNYVHFHALRHTFATNCVNLGFDVKTLSMILGHSSVSMTLNTYVHPSVSVMKSYMERLE